MARTTIRSEDITAGQIKSADLETNVVIDGDLTVDTDTLYVDSTNNLVGIGTSSPSSLLHVSSGTNTDGTDVTITVGGTVANTRQSLITKKIQSSDRALEFYAASGGASEDIRFFRDNTNETMRIDASGNLLVGTTTFDSNAENLSVGSFAFQNGSGKLLVHSSLTPIELARTAGDNASRAQVLFFREGSSVGQINCTNTATTYNTSSDYRLKEDWQPMSGSIDRVKSLKPVNFAWKVDGSRTDGFLAHEVQEVVSEAIVGTKDAMKTEEYEVTPAVFNDEGVETTAAVMGTREVPEYQGIDQSKLVPLLTSALQEAVAKIESLEARVAALEAN